MLKVLLCCGSTLCVRMAVLFHRRCSSTSRWKWSPMKASRRRPSRRLTHGAVGSCAGTSCPFVHGLTRARPRRRTLHSRRRSLAARYKLLSLNTASATSTMLTKPVRTTTTKAVAYHLQ
ncbi:hypothetical protein PF005_g1978 [Phytophthora fragariae]|uniref:Secreted protein n=1 Tax=Phytophthora fragariae TaxID=53985 RepID=A0A6A4ETW3_9STRA|nr:hypothetical protein PF009_g1876 [Phytophthora fragariae]KAE9138158.1 hypothetical protein PF007_g1524 [Phytophthora fragariae]KAE9153819.1 hypothetical protein PF006_g2078 [Phytophthora fragariae]KAE9234246.1 hypothetical protein PF005_g1978 [Phytophthora fragariae]KAE9252936.1 hypothetical protein PF004_g1744 [Phytophthora fragariae]